MLYRFLADAVIGFHFTFILFVLFGGFFVFRWRKVMRVHIPCFLWGGAIEIGGWICPLTYLENYFRMKGAAEEYSTSFVEQYILPLIYPDLLFPNGFPEVGFLYIGAFILTLNTLIYWRVWRIRPR